MLDPTGPEGRHGRAEGPGPTSAPTSTTSAGHAMPGDSTVSAWTAVSLILGLVALTGSVTAFCLVTTALVLAWVVRTGGHEDRPVQRTRGVPPPPFGGPAGWV